MLEWKINVFIITLNSTDTYVEVLDGSRVHPETYEWARKMAVDALDYDDTTDDGHPAGALDEILRSPERLKDLDLDAFAEELERQVSQIFTVNDRIYWNSGKVFTILLGFNFFCVIILTWDEYKRLK